MRGRLRDAWMGRLLSGTGRGRNRRLRGMLRWGPPHFQIRALRELLRLEERWVVPIAADLCGASSPGVRRAAARLLGDLGDDAHRSLLIEHARSERSDEGRLGFAVAAVRRGLAVAEGWAVVKHGATRPVATWYGKRDLAAAVGVGPSVVAVRWAQAIAPFDAAQDPAELSPQSSGAARKALRRVLEKEPENREVLVALGAQQHPEDFELIRSQLRHGGRRGAHATSIALGLNGDPRAGRLLTGVLQAMDVDPGHGFQGRRLAGLALGQLGLPDLGPVLLRALESEALDFEGRPGAGLGIQYPVRSALLYALGESGHKAAAGVLVGYLANTHGSALGGFHLPAMDGLIKLGAVSELEPLLAGPELVVANALGVLGALGQRALVEPFLNDERPQVTAAAACALDHLGSAVVDTGRG